MKLGVELLEKAILFAVKKHRGQVRKGNGRPYIMHPMSVMSRLYQIKESKNIYLLAIACILHDVVEDCDVSIKKIAKKFGQQVASLVDELTSNPERILILGKTVYLIEKMKNMSSYALVIKLCDRLDNICDMDGMTSESKEKSKVQTYQIIESLEEIKLTKTHIKLIKLIKKELKRL